MLDVICGKDVGVTLADQPDSASSLLDASFHQSSMAGDVSPGHAEILTTLRLCAMEPDIARQFGDAGLKMDRLSFLVGRVYNGHEKRRPDVDLGMEDKRPFNLSRRHFAIEANGAGLLIRDCGSFHGAAVNGATLGASEVVLTAQLRDGEHEIIAGNASSPFRFTLTIGRG